ncbi:hypothetical protein ABZ897_00510 [Nonomuraea sp. NPDC046802]|uniref:hypothetical protein n=1 Tax=Nonomuraea sp. NPDC046802 TaxID=3154919 RepID=UPI0033C5DF3D
MFELLKNVLAVVGFLTVAAFGAIVGWVTIAALAEWCERRTARRREQAEQMRALNEEFAQLVKTYDNALDVFPEEEEK